MRLSLSSSVTPLAVALLLGVLIGCISPPPATDYVIVEPVAYVSPPATPVPNSSFGWLPVEATNARAFRVKVGNKQYLELLKRVGAENIKMELARFAEREVIAQKLCPTGAARTKTPQLVGPRNGEYLWVLVECVKT
jgi:hypothetical protein